MHGRSQGFRQAGTCRSYDGGNSWGEVVQAMMTALELFLDADGVGKVAKKLGKDDVWR